MRDAWRGITVTRVTATQGRRTRRTRQRDTLTVHELAQLVRTTMRERNVTQPELARRVATDLGEPVVGQGSVSRWLDDVTALTPARMFAIERALELAPGTVTRLLPVPYEPPHDGGVPTVLDAIDAAPELTPTMRDLLRGAYLGLVRPTR